MTNKKKGKHKGGGGRQQPAGEAESSQTRAQAEAPSHDSTVEGNYARYKRSTAAVQTWCEALVGRCIRNLCDWEDAMEALFERGQNMPADVRSSLDTAIALREESNWFYRAIGADEHKQHRHWHVVKLLRRFRRLFSAQTKHAPAVAPPAAAEPLTASAFEQLEIEATDAASDDDDADKRVTARVERAAAKDDDASAKEEERVFAFACLMSDAARTRDEVRKAWAGWTPADDHGAGLLAAAAEAGLAVTQLERIVNAMQLTLGLPDTNLSTFSAMTPAPRVQLRGLQARPELNGRHGVIQGRDSVSGRYLVQLDGAEKDAPPIKAKALNVCGEHAWDARPEALLGILQEVGRALADFDHAYEPPTCVADAHPDYSTLLNMYVSNGTLWQWTNYAQGIGNYGAGETLWRRHLRTFLAQREAKKGSRDVGFIVALLIAASVETTIFLAMKGLDMRPQSIGAPVARELDFFKANALSALAAAPITNPMIRSAISTNLEALEIALENKLTAMMNVWLAADVLEITSRIAGPSMTAKIMWAEKGPLTIMTHVYHALRACGHLRAIAEVDALLRVFRRSVFFRTENLPTRGTRSFSTAMALSMGATASSLARGTPEMKHGRVIDHTGIEASEISLLRYLDEFSGSGMDTSQLDFRAIASEEVAVLNRAPSFAGALKLLHVRDSTRQAGLRESDVMKEADGEAGDASARHARCWESVFPGCSCMPPAPEAAVTLVFSSYTHVAPTKGLRGAYSSSYTPTTERLTKEQLKQRYRDQVARAKGAR